MLAVVFNPINTDIYSYVHAVLLLLLFAEMLGIPCFRNAGVVIAAGYLIDKFGNRGKIRQSVSSQVIKVVRDTLDKVKDVQDVNNWSVQLRVFSRNL